MHTYPLSLFPNPHHLALEQSVQLLYSYFTVVFHSLFPNDTTITISSIVYFHHFHLLAGNVQTLQPTPQAIRRGWNLENIALIYASVPARR